MRKVVKARELRDVIFGYEDHIRQVTINGVPVMYEHVAPYIHEDKLYYCERGAGGRKVSTDLDAVCVIEFRDIDERIRALKIAKANIQQLIDGDE